MTGGALFVLALAATSTGGAPGAAATPAAAPAEVLPRKDVPPLVKAVFD